tara:strand:- start:6886 stop:7332 length:447 start_codon:yes stop_codon:yes gene_type:complete
MIPNTAQEEDQRTRERRLSIYKHLATQVGGISAGDKKQYLCKVIVKLCMGKTPQNNKPSVVDCYYVWCEVMDISLQEESLGSLFPSDEPSADQELRNMFLKTYDEVCAEYNERQRKREWLQQKSLRNVLGLDHPHDSYKEYLESLGEE